MKIIKNNYKKILEYFVYLIVIIFALLALSSKFSIGGIKLLVVKSGSMEPSIKTGSIIIVKNLKNYNISDIITFKNTSSNATNTHRIINIKCIETNCKFKTKGDANIKADSDLVRQENIIGKSLIAIPYLGYLSQFVKTLPGLIIVVIIPGTIIIYEELKKIYIEIKKINQNKKS